MSVDFERLPHLGIQELVPYKPGKSTESLVLEKGITDSIKLASNENPLGCSPKALQALTEMSSHLIATYPAAEHHPLMPALAKKCQVNLEQLFVGNGSDTIFGLLLQCFALHRDKHILTHEYAFSTYAIQAKALNIPVVSVPVNSDWSVAVDKLIAACTPQTALIFLANPNNPTGLLISQENIKKLLDHVPATTLVVIDEAYYEFAADHMSCNSIGWLQQHPNLVITRTFSKVYGLAGLRIGYALTHPSIVGILRRVQLPFVVNQAALLAAEAALQDTTFVEASLTNNREGLLQVRAGLDALGLSYLPSACNFLTVDCGEDAMLAYNFLLDQGIIVRPLHPYKLPNFLRISIGTLQQNTRLLKALTSYFKENNHGK